MSAALKYLHNSIFACYLEKCVIFFQKLFHAFTLTMIAAALPLSVEATSFTVKIDKDGKTYAIERPGPFTETLKCNSLKAFITIQKTDGKAPRIMAVITPLNSSITRPARFISGFDGLLDDHHILEDIDVGCLSDGGGIGIIFKTSDAKQEAAYIQIDTNACIHPNFKQTGYNLKPAAE